MIKAVWLVVLCGVVFAIAATVRIDGDAPVALAVAETEPTTVGVSFGPDSANESSVMKRWPGDEAPSTAAGSPTSSTDTLTKADRLEVAPAPAPAETAPAPVAALAADPSQAATPASPAVKPAPKAAERSRHDAHAKMIAAPSPTGQAKATPPKKSTTIARAKAEAKPTCRRPEGFAGFLRSLNIGPRCAT